MSSRKTGIKIKQSESKEARNRYMREYRKKRAKEIAEYRKEWVKTKMWYYDRKRDKKKHAIYTRICRLVKAGELKKPNKCQICNSTNKIYGHHEDYNKPLEVIWVCARCHSRLHREE